MDDSNVVYKRTPMGEDLYDFIQELQRWEQMTDPKQQGLQATAILGMAREFEQKWKQNVFELIQRVFGD